MVWLKYVDSSFIRIEKQTSKGSSKINSHCVLLRGYPFELFFGFKPVLSWRGYSGGEAEMARGEKRGAFELNSGSESSLEGWDAGTNRPVFSLYT